MGGDAVTAHRGWEVQAKEPESALRRMASVSLSPTTRSKIINSILNCYINFEGRHYAQGD